MNAITILPDLGKSFSNMFCAVRRLVFFFQWLFSCFFRQQLDYKRLAVKQSKSLFIATKHDILHAACQ